MDDKSRSEKREESHHVVTTASGWKVCLFSDSDGHLNIDVHHEDRTEVLDTGECPGAADDFPFIGWRLTTSGIEQRHTGVTQ